jgi:hypothetical protein
MGTGQCVTLALAVWGSALSTFVAVRQIRRERPGLKLFIRPSGHPSGRLEAVWIVKVANPNTRPVEVTNVALIDHEGLQASMEDPVPPIETRIQGRAVSGLPAILADGESLEVVLPEPLPERVPRGAWALDSMHRLYLSNYPLKRSKSVVRAQRLVTTVRDRSGRALRTKKWQEREREQARVERKAQRILDRGGVTPVPPRAPFTHEEQMSDEGAPNADGP